MKKCYLVLFVISMFTWLNSFGQGQVVNFEDLDFRDYLLSNDEINLNGDDYIQISEAQAFDGQLEISDKGFHSLKGIRHFINLKYLLCSNNNLTELNLKDNVSLKVLFCAGNQINELDLSNNSLLESLNCASNDLELLNIANGNNENFISFFGTTMTAINNPNLECIQVDEGINSINTNDWSFDGIASLSENCSVGVERMQISDRSIMFRKDDVIWHFDYAANDVPMYSFDNGFNWFYTKPDVELIKYSETGMLNDVFYCIGGYHNSARSRTVQYSEDGIHWESYEAPFAGRRKHAVIEHNNCLYVIGGEAGNAASQNDVWFTEDGLHWEKATSTITSNTPTFYEAGVVSFNNKIIIIGGQNSEFGSVMNQDVVYVSDDDGESFSEYDFPFDVELNKSVVFVYNNKLWLTKSTPRYVSNPDASYITQPEKRYYTSIDGMNWEIESEINDYSNSTYYFNNENTETFVFTEYFSGTERRVFKETDIEVNTIRSFIHDDHEEILQLQLTNSSNNYEFCIRSSNEDVLPVSALHVDDNKLIIEPDHSKTGQTRIDIEVKENGDIELISFWFFNFPGEKVALSSINNKLYYQGETPANIKLEYDNLEGYGDNEYIFESSDPTFIDPAEMSVDVMPILNFEFLSLGSSFTTNQPGESMITVTTTDGTYSSSTTFWIKVGEDQAPIAANSFNTYYYSSLDFEYQIPVEMFSDPEGQELYYHSDNLPCGLGINPETGLISGSLLDFEDFDIHVYVKDRYGNMIMEILPVRFDSNVDINKIEDIELMISPNPASNNVIVRAKNRISSIRVYDMKGRIVFQQTTSSNTESLDVSKMDRGVYFIEAIVDEGLRLNRKLIVFY